MRKLAFVLGCLVTFGAAACDTEDPPPNAYQPADTVTVSPNTGVAAQSVGITTGDTLTSPPGAGVGVFVEYAGSGEWYVWTTCDTQTSGSACGYNLFLSVNGASIAYEHQDPADTNGNNAVSSYDGSTVEADFTTSNETDGLRVHVDPPGAPLTVTAWLDGTADPRLFYWYGDGVLHTGAPTDPLALTPNTP